MLTQIFYVISCLIPKLCYGRLPQKKNVVLAGIYEVIHLHL